MSPEAGRHMTPGRVHVARHADQFSLAQAKTLPWIGFENAEKISSLWKFRADSLQVFHFLLKADLLPRLECKRERVCH